MVRYLKEIVFCFSVLCLLPIAVMAEKFDPPELQVTPSPVEACSIRLEGVEKVVDYDVSPAGPEVAVLVKKTGGDHGLVFWQIGTQGISEGWKAPAGFMLRAVAWHPQAQALFVAGVQKTHHQIVRLDKTASGWTARRIFESPNEIRRLVMGPRPFAVGSEQEPVAYRLFLGMKNQDGKTYRIVSITEQGKKPYQVIGPADTVTDPGKEETPSELMAASALPMAFHPAGHKLICEDEARNYYWAEYATNRWGTTTPLMDGMLKGGSVTPTPNGLGLLHWQPSLPGIGLVVVSTGKADRQAVDMQFVATPSSVPDGRGIVGLTKSSDGYSLTYVPIAVPLADVVNAWLFHPSDQDLSLLEKHGGSFRALDDSQLYELYHSENYGSCGEFTQTVSTRPYLVTTDIFWELFAAAFEGLMIVQEREKAIPAFWKFIAAADQFYGNSTVQSPWKQVFKALADMRSKDSRNPETARIRAAKQREHSETLGVEVDYAELKPRGHYTSSDTMKGYFKAFRYLTSVYSVDGKRAKIMGELETLPPELQNQAVAWINCYKGFIAPSRSPLVWKGGAAGQPASTRHSNPVPAIFPLSWGFDNEVLYSTVFHPHLPRAEQVSGPAGERLTPSGLDLALALGSHLADTLLESEYGKYPPLKGVLENLRKNFVSSAKTMRDSENLYDRWISALALQWADDVQSPNGEKDERIWRAKRLQTGLASWATLRHATVLVNERTDAQCGEGGFEAIVMRFPRGYVEPDPRTFAAIAGLFDTAVGHVAQNILNAQDITARGGDQEDGGSKSLREGIIRRFKQTAGKARRFQSMAEKEIRGEPLTYEECQEILDVGKVAEHHFLVFKSLGSKDYALSTPEDIPKIADVAGGKFAPFLMAAVGKPVEWDHVVPYFGRRQIVKGSVYSYYEFESSNLLNDEEWRSMVESQPRPAWLRPFFAEEKPGKD